MCEHAIMYATKYFHCIFARMQRRVERKIYGKYTGEKKKVIVITIIIIITTQQQRIRERIIIK